MGGGQQPQLQRMISFGTAEEEEVTFRPILGLLWGQDAARSLLSFSPPLPYGLQSQLQGIRQGIVCHVSGLTPLRKGGEQVAQNALHWLSITGEQRVILVDLLGVLWSGKQPNQGLISKPRISVSLTTREEGWSRVVRTSALTVMRWGAQLLWWWGTI